VLDYGLPRADEVPFLEIDENPVPTKTNPLGAEAAGEAGNVPALAAILNAVIDAPSLLGIPHLACRAHPKKSGARSARCNCACNPNCAGLGEP